MQIYLANPRGFCAGVDRAIEILDLAVSVFKKNIYVKHDIVHNKNIIKDFKSKGVQFIEAIDSVPQNSVLIFSAHGVSSNIVNQAKKRNLTIFDATCPLVSKVHMQVAKYSQKEYDCILIGHKNHPEVEGTMGRFFGKKGKIYLVDSALQAKKIEINQSTQLGLVTQTTLSLDDTKQIIDILINRFPDIQVSVKQDICYATQNRQDAIKLLAKKTDITIVIGSQHSSNSNRLVEISKNMGTQSILIDNPDEIDLSIFDGKQSIGITSGASAPEAIVQDTINFLKQQFKVNTVEEISGIEEDIYFKLPKELTQLKLQST